MKCPFYENFILGWQGDRTPFINCPYIEDGYCEDVAKSPTISDAWCSKMIIMGLEPTKISIKSDIRSIVVPHMIDAGNDNEEIVIEELYQCFIANGIN